MSGNSGFKLLTALLVRTGLKPHRLAEAMLPQPLLQALYRLIAPKIPDRDAYLPFFQPWRADADFQVTYGRISAATLVSADRCWVIRSLARQALGVPGAFYECGVYRGGTAYLLRRVLDGHPDKVLRLFDTFRGMPETVPGKDFHKPGDFAATSLEVVQALVGSERTTYHPGLIPDTFADLSDELVAFAHIDVDIWKSVADCCAALYPRLAPGGVLVFDDYGYMTCPGAREAVDDFFADKPEVPLVFGNGQAVVTKLP